MKTLNIYDDKLSILMMIISSYCGLLLMYWYATRQLRNKFGENWYESSQTILLDLLDKLLQLNIPLSLLLVFIFPLIYSLVHSILLLLETFFGIITLCCSKKPKIIINKYNISSDVECKSIDWDSIASFKFVHDKYHTNLHLLHRPNGNYLRLVKRETVFSLQQLDYDEEKLSQLLTQLIETVDENKREILIANFQAA